jgi:hypothetical protein
MKRKNNKVASPHIFLAALVVVASLGLFAVVWAATPLDIAGFLDFSFGVNPGSKVTGEKPESKLWWNSGYWWASLYDTAAGEYHIYRLNSESQNWLNTGVVLDDRPASRADILWDESSNKLYVASHIHSENAVSTTNPLEWARLYRYTFIPSSLTYTLDAGYPVTINQDRTETLVLDKDSLGRLWVTYVSRQSGTLDYHIYVNVSQGSDQSWGTPFKLTLPETAVNRDDISSLITFSDNDGPKIGVMWSDQEDGYFHFATHSDSSAPQDGWSLETITAVGYPADDHINLAATASGQILAAVKLETTAPGDPLMGIIGRDRDGTFSFHPITFVSSMETRPTIVINASTNEAYVFATNKSTGGNICYWSAAITIPLSNLNFPQLPCLFSGASGAPSAIGDTTYSRINNVTSTKQNVNNSSGIAVLASDEVNGQVYVHNLLFQLTPTPSPSETASPTASATPSTTVSPPPTSTSTASATPSATMTPTPTSTSTTSATPSTTVSPTPTSTSTATVIGTPSITPSPSATPVSEPISQIFMPVIQR